MQNSAELENIAKHKNRKEAIVFTNGCFDLLHVGHIRYLKAARDLGHVLVIGLNSDASVTRLKGSGRPLILESERKEMLLSLRMVDYVCMFDEDTPLQLINEVKPDILVKGGDWPVEKIIGADFVKSYGGRVVSLPYVAGRSTTELLKNILRLRTSS